MIRHRMYINGRLDRAVDNANLGLYNYSQYGYLGLGNTSESYMDGLLDEVMVFNQSLTDMQANELSNAQAAEYGRFTVLHDAAGNLTRDHRGYEYEYDYENRMILVKKPLGAGFVAVATFEYDALGRRIEKVDAIAGTTTRYYYDDQRVAVQTLVSGGVETDDRYFVFGNYIDETLVMHVIPAQAGTQDLYYAHDHLYSPVALFAANGTVAERYEYDAYGKVQILTSNFSPLTSSQHGNPYAFTGRELDTLDAGRRTLMYYRARTYDPETGRFMQKDPLGINPAGGRINPFSIRKQYNDGMALFEYVRSNPVSFNDPFGLDTCGDISCSYPESIEKLPFPVELPSGEYVEGWFDDNISRWELIIESKPCPQGDCASLIITKCVHTSVIAYWDNSPNADEVLRHERHHQYLSIQAFDRAVRRFRSIAKKCPCGPVCICSKMKTDCYVNAANLFKTAYHLYSKFGHAYFDCHEYEDGPAKDRRCQQMESYLNQYVKERSKAEKKLYECDRTL